MANLSLCDVAVGYGDRPVLRGVTLEVSAGEVVALLGPNGVGKSTLVRAVSGVLDISSGSIRIADFDSLRLRPRERARLLAVVPQAVSLPEAFTVWEVVLMGRTPHLGLFGTGGERDCMVVREAMCRAAVEDLAERRVGELSGGERQRVVLARALAQEPKVMLLDEATAHLDLKHQVALLMLVRRLARKEGLAVLLTLHDLNQAVRFADRVALLSKGELRAVGAPAEVLTSENLSSVYGLPVNVVPHPEYGTPLVLADGVDHEL